MLLELIRKKDFLRKSKFVKKQGYKRARIKVNDIMPYLKEGNKILDIGAGPCFVCDLLRSRGLHVSAMDIKDLSFFDNIDVVVYDGKKFPFVNKEFDFALLLSVLHHTTEPEQILKEAMRVSNQIIIIEDLQKGKLHKFFDKLWDSLENLEFLHHPHSNKTDQEWRFLFKQLGLKINDVKYRRFLSWRRRAQYYLKVP